MTCDFRASKGQMTIYGMEGVRHVVHRESRCQDCRQVLLIRLVLELISYSRLGLFHGYRICKGGKKLYEQDALRNKSLGEDILLHFCLFVCFDRSSLRDAPIMMIMVIMMIMMIMLHDYFENFSDNKPNRL